MTDPVSTARGARETLSRGLNALQADPSVPPAVSQVVTFVAQAMAALHAVERSEGRELSPHADVALQNVRSALTFLQGRPQTHPAVAKATEAVASSLAAVHGLHRQSQGAAPAAAPAAPSAAIPAAPVRSPAAFAATAALGAQPFAASGVDPFAAPAPAAAPPAPPAPVHAGLNAPPSDLPLVEAGLGAQSPTNFYKGLSGNDIIDHGGIFVATYNRVPKVGLPLRLRVSLPGGYEFEADAVVKWRREHSEGSDAPPGFGAQFTGITQEARQLVYRYVRNREPLFHDDF